jgi:branched-subunit amino acid ABC-type transport system permease component
VGSGLSLIFGVMRIVTLSHGSSFMLGGYVALTVIWTTGSWLLATPASAPAERGERKAAAVAATSKLRLRVSLWQNRLPVDSLPLEGWIELLVVSEGDLIFGT